MDILHQLGIDPKVILIQIIGFLILFAVLKKFLFGKVGELLSSRQKEIKDNQAQIEKQREDTQKLKEEYEKHLAKIEEEIRERIAQSIKEGQEDKEEIIQEAREEARKVMEKAKEQIEIEKEKAKVELHKEVANLALLAASKVIGETLDEATHRRLINDFIEGIEELPS